MLYEIKDIKQYPDEPRRRWFFDHSLDLTVWFDDRNEIIRIQLCYNKPQAPHALTWDKTTGYQHHRIDDGEGEQPVKPKGIPILLMDGPFSHRIIGEAFRQNSLNIEEWISDFVYQIIMNYTSPKSFDL